MKRVIKFRVWDKQLKYIRYLDAGHDSIMFSNNGMGFYWNLQNGDGNLSEESGYSNFMQFTGLTDKNGREIYEGDIVKIVHPFRERTHIGEVIWEDYRFNIVEFYFTHFDYPSEAFSEGTEYIEVIGNIFENKDLLEVQRSETV